VSQTPAAELPPWASPLLRRIALYVIGLGLAVYLARRLSDFLFTLFVAFFLSLALEPAVKWLHEHGWRRGLATFAVILVAFVLGAGMVAIMIPAVVSQLSSLVRVLPDWLSTLSQNLQHWFHIDLSTQRIQEELAKAGQQLAGYAGNLAGNVLGIGARVVGGVFKILTVGLFTFYFVADGPKVRRGVCSLFTPQKQKQVLDAWDVAIDKTGGYLYSRLLLAAVNGSAALLVMSIMGIPFALPLAVWVGVISQFVPAVGTYIAMAVPLLVAVFEDPMKALWLLIYFTLYQQFENYVLSPRITAKTMELHPAIAFGSAIVGAIMWGPVGAFLALPFVATLQSGVLVYLVERHEVIEDELTEEEPPEDEEPERPDEGGSKGGLRRFFHKR
jgi:predicted PurR-regulated permease PerM